MTLIARSDVMSATVPVASGGCGKTHSRPVHNGKPDKVFKIECDGCETYLKQDIIRSGMKKMRTGSDRELKDRYLGLWGWNDDTVPETFDEEREREHNEQVTTAAAANANKDALTTIAAALAGNQELMAKLVAMSQPQQAPSVPVYDPILPVPVPEGEIPEPRQWQYPVGGPVRHPGSRAEPVSAYNQHPCKDCGTPITRKPGQKGALALRCPACKAKAVRKR